MTSGILVGRVTIAMLQVLPVCLIGRDKAGNIAQDPTAALDDGERVRVTAVGKRSH